MPPTCNFRPSPAKMHATTHTVQVNQTGAGGALQGSWDVPSAHSIDRTSAQVSVTDQFDAAISIQRAHRGHSTRGKLAPAISVLPPGANIYDFLLFSSRDAPGGNFSAKI